MRFHRIRSVRSIDQHIRVINVNFSEFQIDYQIRNLKLGGKYMIFLLRPVCVSGVTCCNDWSNWTAGSDHLHASKYECWSNQIELNEAERKQENRPQSFRHGAQWHINHRRKGILNLKWKVVSCDKRWWHSGMIWFWLRRAAAVIG